MAYCKVIMNLRYCKTKQSPLNSYFLLFFFTMKNEIRNVTELWICIIHKTGNENINYRKLVTSLYNIYLKTMVNCW